MFKGIIASRQAALESAASEFDAEKAFDAFVSLEEVHAQEVEDMQREETLKNARALHSALEQFKADPTATRALLSFADADGQLSAAFGITHEGALESIDDTQIMVDAAAISAGLEAYVCEETKDVASVEGIREILDRKKAALASLGGIVGAAVSMFHVAKAAFKVGASQSTFTAAVTAGRAVGFGLGFLVTGGTLYLVNKAVNKNNVAGTAAEFDELLTRIEGAMEIIKITNSVKTAADFQAVPTKIKSAAEKAGITIKVDSTGFEARLTGQKDIKRKMVKWEESGWTPEKVKAAAASYKKLVETLAFVIRDADKNNSVAESSEVYTDIEQTLDSVFDVSITACMVARKSVTAASACLKSASRFVSPEKEEESTKEED